jgi:hypothetical protein
MLGASGARKREPAGWAALGAWVPVLAGLLAGAAGVGEPGTLIGTLAGRVAGFGSGLAFIIVLPS